MWMLAMKLLSYFISLKISGILTISDCEKNRTESDGKDMES